MNIFENIKFAVLVSILEIIIFFGLFYLIEYLYLGKEANIALRETVGNVVARIIFLQIVVQIVAVFIFSFLSKNIYITYLVMLVSLLLYSLLIKGESISFSDLFSFGAYGNTTPIFLVYMLSSAIALLIYKKFFLISSSS